MNKEEIIKYLEENGLSDIEDLEYKGNAVVLRFTFDFDEDEINAAKAYADDESEDETEGDTWYNDFFLPYLNELAIDNVGEIIEESMEELDLESQFVSYEIDRENYNYNEFIAVFYKRGLEIDIDQVLEELEK
ncbi:hypothetical protein [Clostridium thailandense]|uniref:Uncharacterized protein n=1 Tax=Clostridium thailandense TaxID=2794346 RepID=A0A949TPP8_9CLOT|nr:hypothetical protein [Clostridium thailandense]MBV7276270.1 hypothetical protein [Clostridium thailandense]